MGGATERSYAMTRLIYLSGLALAVGACTPMMTSYDMRNQATEQQVTCRAWSSTVFDAGATADPGPFQQCITACAARGFVAALPPPPKPTTNVSVWAMSHDVPAECQTN
jgi:hypothetical protein